MRARPFLLAALFAALPVRAVACPALGAGGSPLTNWIPPSQVAPYHAMPIPRGAVVFGEVRTTSGVPVAGAQVVARPLSPGGVADRAVTDRQGHYVLRHLVPSAIALSVVARGMGTVGPLPFRVPVDDGRQPLPQRFDIGGMGPAVPRVPPARTGGALAGRVIHLPGVTRDLIADGRGGVEGLELAGLATLSSHGARAGIGFGALTLAASWVPGPSRRLYAVSGAGAAGKLSAFSRLGREIWCRQLPFQPTDVAAGSSGTAYVAGAHDGLGVVVVVSPAGHIIRTIALSPGSPLQAATDEAGDAWIADRSAGLIRLDSRGIVKARLYLPETPQIVYPTSDGGLWAVGGGLATRFDSRQHVVARVIRPRPIELSASDGQNRLWILEEGKLLAFTPHSARSYSLAGMPISGAASLAVDRNRQLWLLGLDRQRVVVARVP